MAAIWAVIIGEVFDVHENGEKNVFFHPWAYQVFAICVTFTLVFRNSISYNRFWEGCAQIAFMRSKMVDVAMQALAFDRIYNTELAIADQKNWDGQSTLYKTQRFQRRIVHLMSMLHANALLALRKRTVDLEFQPLSYLTSHERNWSAKQLQCVGNPDSLLLPSAIDMDANETSLGPTDPATENGHVDIPADWSMCAASWTSEPSRFRIDPTLMTLLLCMKAFSFFFSF